MLEEGSLFFVNWNKSYLGFYRFVSRNDPIGYIVNRVNVKTLQFTLDTIPINNSRILHVFPPSTLHKRTYDIGDKVYYIGSRFDHELIYGKVIGIGGFNIETYGGERIEGIPDENLFPYKWYQLHPNCKLAIYEWSKCALRTKIYKDIRVLIAKYIWKSRNDYCWLCKV